MIQQTIHLIAAARPNFMKIAPLWHALNASEAFTPVLIHTGQHYDPAMSDSIFADLGLGDPDHHLGIGSGTHAQQTGQVMIAYEEIVMANPPACVVVVGDVNSTLACALVATKLHVKVVHLEAGLRSRDRSMPEEINRLATDAISDVLWVPSQDGVDNLTDEGVEPSRMSLVGNIMMDSYELVRPAIDARREYERHGLSSGGYGVVTLHRPANVDTEAAIRAMLDALIAVQAEMPLIFPVHPRTRKKMAEFGLQAGLEAAGIIVIEPVSYIPFMSLVSNAALAITDSGGIQEETTYLGIPCFTLRENTERPITITQGTNQLVSTETLAACVRRTLNAERNVSVPALWDGKTAQRCVEDLARRIVTRS